MVVDISGSMEALDLSTPTQEKTRLDAVKEAFREFVDRRPDDLIGLVAFGGFATTRSPLTLDHDGLKMMLEAVQIPRQGEGDREELMTAIGDALVLACARLDQASNVVSKIAVLLTDGDSNAGIASVEEATQLAKKLGIKVYAIGVGSNGRAPMRVTDPFGRRTVQWMKVTMDERALKRIADQTGGIYFGVADRDGLAKAMEQIDTLETTRVDETLYEYRTEHFVPWLLSGAALLLAAVALATALERRIA
ncbi:MAG: VWA domain-containing protein [Kiritimatiellaeota bacterium]|nr:VWA domain-containing protein [Kiritimatiellota bacterium]